MDWEKENKKEERFDLFYLNTVKDWVGYLRGIDYKRSLGLLKKKKNIQWWMNEYYKNSDNKFLIMTISFYKGIEGKESNYSIFHFLLIDKLLRGLDWSLKEVKRKIIGRNYKEEEDLLNVFCFGGDRKKGVFPHIHSLLEINNIDEEEYKKLFLESFERNINRVLRRKKNDLIEGYIKKDDTEFKGYGFSLYFQRLDENKGVEGYDNYMKRYEGDEYGFGEEKIIFNYRLFNIGKIDKYSTITEKRKVNNKD